MSVVVCGGVSVHARVRARGSARVRVSIYVSVRVPANQCCVSHVEDAHVRRSFDCQMSELTESKRPKCCV